jgi:hypothetical protein
MQYVMLEWRVCQMERESTFVASHAQLHQGRLMDSLSVFSISKFVVAGAPTWHGGVVLQE